MMKSFFILHLKLVLFACWTLIASSDHYSQNYPSQNFTVNDGLPSNQVYDIYQDKNGVVWFATDRGISSYNGSYFTTYSLEDGLPDHIVFGFFPQEDGYVWCTTKSAQLVRFHPDSLIFNTFKYNNLLKEFEGMEGRDLLVINNTHIRIKFLNWHGFIEINSEEGLKKHSFHHFDSKQRHCYLHQNGDYWYMDTKKSAFFPKLTSFYRDNHFFKNGRLYRTSPTGFEIIDSTGYVAWMSFDNLGNEGLITDIGELPNGFWLGTRTKGLIIYDLNGNRIKSFLPGVTCSNYLIDRDGGEWVATLYNGVIYFPKSKIYNLEVIGSNDINSISINQNSQLVVGLSDPYFYVFDHQLNVVKEFENNGQPAISQYSFFTDKYVSNAIEDPIVKSFVRKFSDDRTQPILIISAGAIKSESGIFIYSVPESNAPRLLDAEYLKKEEIIIATEQEIIKTTHSNTLQKTTLSVEARDIDIHENKIFCATKGKGVIILDTNLHELDRIGSSDGLNNLYLNEILVVNDHELWIASENGLYNAIRNDHQWNCQRISTNNGLSSNYIKDIEIIGDTIFIGTRSGVNYFSLHDLNKIIYSVSGVYLRLKNIKVNGNLIEYHSGETLSLKHFENRVALNFDLATFIHNSEILFRYKIIGLNSNWTLTRDRSISFESLPPGEYTIIIQPIINGQIYDESLSVVIYIKQAFYKTWWFILSIICVFIFITWIFFKYRILNYNREIIREILRYLLQKIKPSTKSFIVRSDGKDVKINSEDIHYIESNGNYINIHLTGKKVIVREKLSNFKELVPDPLEFVQIRRSVIIRIDKVTSKNKEAVFVDNKEFKVGITYKNELKKIHL